MLEAVKQSIEEQAKSMSDLLSPTKKQAVEVTEKKSVAVPTGSTRNLPLVKMY